MRGEIYSITTDNNSLVHRDKEANLCKGLPNSLVKYINMQMTICKANKYKRQSNVQHVNEAHNYKLKSTRQVIEEVRKLNEEIKAKAKKEAKKKPKRIFY